MQSLTHKKRNSKILLLDIETAPNLGFIWGKWEQDVIEYDSEWYVLCFAAKWLGEKTFARSLRDYKLYKKDKENDISLAKELWHLLDMADIVIAHNGDSFDLRKINTRFVYHKFAPPSPYKTVDTLKVARKYYSFNSNKLNDLAQTLHIGKKIETGGFKLWKGCMEGDESAWDKMIRYNMQDVRLLERVYLRLLPWIENHPPTGERGSCVKCGSGYLQSRGFLTTKVGKKPRLHCPSCGGWQLGKINDTRTRKTSSRDYL